MTATNNRYQKICDKYERLEAAKLIVDEKLVQSEDKNQQLEQKLAKSEEKNQELLEKLEAKESYQSVNILVGSD